MTLPKRFLAWNGKQMIVPDYIDRNGLAWWKENSIPVCSKDVVQWTGIDDLYEGDICTTKIRICTDSLPFTGEPETKGIEIKGEIIFKEGMFVLKGYEGRYELVLPGREIKKVGNKYQKNENSK